MKVTKSQIKELIRHAIVELTEKTFGSQAQYDAYRKKHNLKPGSKHKVAGKTVTVRDTKKMSKKAKSLGDRMADKLNKRMADLEKKRKQGKIKESKRRRYTVKEVRMWMKKLEENRYKKVYNSDARRVAWMVNNEGVSLDEMPISMKKKWTKAQYGRERYLATEFLKSKSEQMNESVWSLPKGATTTSVDELDAELSRAGIKSNPDFTKLLVQVSGNKSKINKIMKTHKAKKIFEGKLTEAIKKVSDAEDGAGFRQDWIGIYKGKFIQFKANFPVDAKKHTINHFKVPKSKYSEVVVISKKEYDAQQKLKVEQKLRESIREIIKEQLNEAITGSDRKILFILVRDIVRNLKSKIKNFDVNNKSHLNRVGSSILAIIRAMTYSPDNVNYKNFKKYFPKNFNSKLIQKKLKQFHSQNDKVQVTLVTQAIKNELGAGVNEKVLTMQGKKSHLVSVNVKDIPKVKKILGKKFKENKEWVLDAQFPKRKTRGVVMNDKIYNQALELLMKNRITVRG